MEEAVALARLRINVQPEVYPTLSELELSDLLMAHALPDAYGRVPYSLDWVGSWDIRAASRKGWLLKAGKAVPDVTFTGDGTQQSLSDVHQHCLNMADKYQALGNIRVGAYR